MRIIVLSDTHGQHKHLPLPKGDILIHAGDVSSSGRRAEVTDFLEWFSAQPHPHKIFIAGNHDFFFEQSNLPEVLKILPEGVIYLNDSGAEINGVNFWGSPITPWFNNWAFNRYPGEDIKQHWTLIPEKTDILITHGPPFEILDKTVYGERTGCPDLLRRIREVKPSYHLFGHIHENYGSLKNGETTFINASALDERYKPKNDAVIIDL